jgi:hypothetical protein
MTFIRDQSGFDCSGGHGLTAFLLAEQARHGKATPLQDG